jgi:hypothetical protein
MLWRDESSATPGANERSIRGWILCLSKKQPGAVAPPARLLRREIKWKSCFPREELENARRTLISSLSPLKNYICKKNKFVLLTADCPGTQRRDFFTLRRVKRINL